MDAAVVIIDAEVDAMVVINDAEVDAMVVMRPRQNKRQKKDNTIQN